MTAALQGDLAARAASGLSRERVHAELPGARRRQRTSLNPEEAAVAVRHRERDERRLGPFPAIATQPLLMAEGGDWFYGCGTCQRHPGRDQSRQGQDQNGQCEHGWVGRAGLVEVG